MRTFLRTTALAASMLFAGWALPGCTSGEDAAAKPEGGAMDKGKMDGGAMDKGKMDAPAK